jgi:paraquat-inducible protein B
MVINMEILNKYIHGSADSTDVDVVYVVDELPSFADCKRFCAEDKAENRNVLTVENGIVINCFKGTPDEINNSLLKTYSLHKQNSPLVIERTVERVVPIKVVRAMRIIISHLSRTALRPIIKSALRGSWSERLDCLNVIQETLDKLDFEHANNNMSAADIKKVLAFQMGQTLALLNGKELYTKAEIASEYPQLRATLYREQNASIEDLKGFMRGFLDSMRTLKVESFKTSEEGIHILFKDYGYSVELLKEQYSKAD